MSGTNVCHRGRGLAESFLHPRVHRATLRWACAIHAMSTSSDAPCQTARQLPAEEHQDRVAASIWPTRWRKATGRCAPRGCRQPAGACRGFARVADGDALWRCDRRPVWVFSRARVAGRRWAVITASEPVFAAIAKPPVIAAESGFGDRGDNGAADRDRNSVSRQCSPFRPRWPPPWSKPTERPGVVGTLDG